MIMNLRNDFLLNEAQKIAKLGIFVYDIRKDLWISSEIFNEIIGIADGDVNDLKSWLNTVHHSQREEMELYINEAIVTGKDMNKEYLLAAPIDGDKRWVVQKGKVYFDEYGIPEKIVGTIQDISELKKSEERYKRLYIEFQRKQAFLESLSTKE